MKPEGVEQFPLVWPDGWDRTPPGRREFARFRGQTVSKATSYLMDELRKLGARHAVLSTNVPVRRDGLPYSDKRNPDDPGAAVYFMLDGRQQCIPCDKWTRVEHNIHAIALTIDCLRGIERYGAKQMVQAAFSGFKALPEGAQEKPKTPWWKVLKVDPQQTDLDQCELMYRHLAKKAHPDSGGDDEQMAELNRAIGEAREQFKAEAS